MGGGQDVCVTQCREVRVLRYAMDGGGGKCSALRKAFLARVPQPVHFESPKNCTFSSSKNGGSNSQFSRIYYVLEHVNSSVLAQKRTRLGRRGALLVHSRAYLCIFDEKARVYTCFQNFTCISSFFFAPRPPAHFQKFLRHEPKKKKLP